MTMWWECSECGGHLNDEAAPMVCPECGTAGAIFMSVESDDPLMGDSDGAGLRAKWLRVGIEEPEVVAGA
jgi:hypothetical protein